MNLEDFNQIPQYLFSESAPQGVEEWKIALIAFFVGIVGFGIFKR